MNYWDAVLYEVLNKHSPDTRFRFTNLDLYVRREQPTPIRPRRRKCVAKPRKDQHYYLGEPYAHVYFTQREAECMQYFLEGATIKDTADEMQLSARTVEYYLGRMKDKLDCRSKSELVKKVVLTSFEQVFNEQNIADISD